MKKKVLAVCLVLAMAMAFTACGKDDKKDKESKVLSEESGADVGISGDGSELNNNSKEATLDDMVKHLQDAGVISGDASEKDAALIGASKGTAYGDVELYEFDKNSDAYKQAADTKKLKIESLDMEISVAAVNGPVVLVFANDSSDQKVIDAFNSYGK